MIQEARQVDLKLRALARTSPPGKPLTQEEIACAAGCSRQYISKIERLAMQKLRPYLDPVWREFRHDR